jgi:hypothetical protein
MLVSKMSGILHHTNPQRTRSLAAKNAKVYFSWRLCVKKLLQAFADGLKMSEHFGWVDVELTSTRQGFLCDAFEFFQIYKIVLNEKDNVVEVSVEAAIQFAERNAVRIGNIDFQVPKLTDADTSFCAPLWQWDKTFDGDWLDIHLQFLRHLHEDCVKFAGMDIVTHKVNVNRQVRTSQQRQRTSTDQNQAGGRGNSFPHDLQDRLDFGVVHN